MERTITVKGMGKASARPDYVVLNMALEARDMEYQKAMELGAAQLAQLSESMVVLGFEKDAVKTTDFNVSTEYESVQKEDGRYHRVFIGFVCRHHLKLSFDFDSKMLAKTLGAAAECLANPELSVMFTVKDPTTVNEELLRSATANAKRKAEILCEASGVALGQLLSINYNWAEINIMSQTRYAMAEDCLSNAAPLMAKGIDIEPEDIDVNDTATFVWEIA